jgi:unsaturated rhamnogalacturonyl hydrolase
MAGRAVLGVIGVVAVLGAAPGEERPWSVRMADSEMQRHPDPLLQDVTNDTPKWDYTQGLIFSAILAVWQANGDQRYWDYARAYYDGMIDADGRIRTYKPEEFNIDRVNTGKPLFLLYAKTHDEKYRKALDTLRGQLRQHPRTKEGGFWHKQRYPHQMWLDGLYMGATFLAQYGSVFGEPAAVDDAVRQFVLMERHARDERTGLLYHGWDESRAQKWADPATGRSASFWGRAVGWYAMALVDTLDFVPGDHAGRRDLVAILDRLAAAVARVQDPKTGLWYQVLDQGGREGNYLEASVSSMLAYALMKASRHGYVDSKYGAAGRRAYDGLLRELIEVDPGGQVQLHRVCQVAGLGSDPDRGIDRDGTYRYYVTEKIRSNDPKGVAPFIFASLEVERSARRGESR